MHPTTSVAHAPLAGASRPFRRAARRARWLRTALLVAACAVSASTIACSGDDGAGDGSGVVRDDSPVTPASAAGAWKLHYEWTAPPPATWVTVFGSNTSGDLDLAVPSGTQKRALLQSTSTSFGFAPMTSIVSPGNVAWSIGVTATDTASDGGTTDGGDGGTVANDGGTDAAPDSGDGGGGGSNFTSEPSSTTKIQDTTTTQLQIDFAGTGTGSNLDGTIQIKGEAATATWRASKAPAAIGTVSSLAGDWTLDFQWSTRTPGQLLLTCDAAGACTVPGGQPGGPTSNDVGAASFTGSELVMKFSSSTQLGVAMSDALLWGYMDANDGNTGWWKATRGRPAVDHGTTGGCTNDVDCSSCERCERTTGRCIARLTC